MRCFSSGKQKQNSSDRTYKLKSTVIFNENSELSDDNYEKNFNGTFCYDASGGVKKAHSYDLLYSNKKGFKVCDPSCLEINPIPDTPSGIHTVMTIPALGSPLVDTSCNYVEDISCNMQAQYDPNGVLTGWIAEPRGGYSVLDPNNILHGDFTDCSHKKYLDYVDICGNIV